MTTVDTEKTGGTESAAAPLLEARELTRHFRVGRGFSRQLLHADRKSVV